MNELQPNYEEMNNEQLVSIIKSQKNELISQEAVVKEYKKHLEQMIEFNSVEKYRETVNRNRGATETTPQDNTSGTAEILNEENYIGLIVESNKREKIAEITLLEAIPADGYRIRLIPKYD